MKIDPSFIAETHLLTYCDLNAQALRQCYRLAHDLFGLLGVQPDRLCAGGPNLPRDYGPYQRRHPLVNTSDFVGLRSLSMVKLIAGGTSELTDWLCSVTVLIQPAIAQLSHIPQVSPRSLPATSRLLRDCYECTGAKYGYLFRQTMDLAPSCYSMGLVWWPSSKIRPREYTMNISWWGRTAGKVNQISRACLLRDIYPRNFLSPLFLYAPVGCTGRTLQQWIEADPASRGLLTPYTDSLSEWTPPIENIPRIREELYRMGRVFHWRFFCPKHINGRGERPEPLYRPDLREPWEAPDEIHEIFRAEYYKDKDPGLIY